jgi:hypothetical protein
VPKRARSEVDPKSTSRTLRTVPHPEAFLFFTDIDKFTGEYALCLDDFYKKLKTIPLESIQFHFGRKDFERWIRETLGDKYLAERITRIKSTRTEDLRKKIERVVKRRLNKLKQLA